MKTLCTIIILFFSSILNAQVVISDEDLKQDINFLAYNSLTNEKLTGFVQTKNRGGEIISVSEYKDGVILESISYKDFEADKVSRITYFHEDNPYVPKKRIKFFFDDMANKNEITYFNESGRKVLQEIFLDKKLTYSCEFLKGNKHGIELTILSDGTEVRVKYHEGRIVD